MALTAPLVDEKTSLKKPSIDSGAVEPEGKYDYLKPDADEKPLLLTETVVC